MICFVGCEVVVQGAPVAVEEDGVVLAGRPRMAWFRVQLTEEEQRVVNEERESHPEPHVRRKMLVLWSLHCGLKRTQAAKLVGVGLATVERYVAAYRDGGLAGLRQWKVRGPVSDLAAHRDAIRASFEQRPVSTIAEACARVEELTGLQRGQTQVRRFLTGLGLKWQRIRAIPVPPKKNWRSTSPNRPCFTTPN
jgi:transposase